MNTPALIKVPDFQRSFVDTREHRRVIRRPTETWHRFLYILRRRHTHTQLPIVICFQNTKQIKALKHYCEGPLLSLLLFYTGLGLSL